MSCIMTVVRSGKSGRGASERQDAVANVSISQPRYMRTCSRAAADIRIGVCAEFP